MTVFKSHEPGPITVITPRGQYLVGAGGEFETDDPDEIASLEANPSLTKQDVRKHGERHTTTKAAKPAKDK